MEGLRVKPRYRYEHCHTSELQAFLSANPEWTLAHITFQGALVHVVMERPQE